MDLADTYSFPLGHDLMRQYAGTTASIHFGTKGVSLTHCMHQSCPVTSKLSDQFIPVKYRALFINIPPGCVPWPMIEAHVRSTLRMVERFIADDELKSQELAVFRRKALDHRAKMKSMTSTINEINDVVRKL